jgi:hypothetical protein
MKTALARLALTLALSLPVLIVAQNMKMGHFVKEVTSTSTPETITATNLSVETVTIRGVRGDGRTANVGTVYIGWTSANDTQFFPVLSNGEIVLGTPGSGRKLRLNEIYVDVLNSGDGVGVYYQ